MQSPKDKERKVSSCCGVGMLWIDGIILACEKCSKKCEPVSPNKPTTHRELYQEYIVTKEDVDKFGLPPKKDLVDFIFVEDLERFIIPALLTSHNTELIRKIEGMKEKMDKTLERLEIKKESFNDENMIKYGGVMHQAIKEFYQHADEVISIITQEK